MNGQADLVGIVNRLVSVENDGDPTVTSIQAAVPDLGRMDWINRVGPAEAWAEIASALRTDHLERLIKSLVIAEREFDWLGGSVAAPIWLYRAYCERADANANTLADWALRNRGGNDYIPFGRMTSARSLEEWHVEQGPRLERRNAHEGKEQTLKDAKARRAREGIERSSQRKKASHTRHGALQASVEKLRTLGASERLSYVATNVDLPLEFIPPDLLAECIPVAPSLDDRTKQVLVRRIDRRRGKIWKKLCVALWGQDQQAREAAAMDQKPKIINIENIRELEPAIYEATVTRADGSKSKERMSVFELQPILQQLGRPMLPS